MGSCYKFLVGFLFLQCPSFPMQNMKSWEDKPLKIFDNYNLADQQIRFVYKPVTIAFSLILKLFLKWVSAYVTKFILNFFLNKLFIWLSWTPISISHSFKPLDISDQSFPEVLEQVTFPPAVDMFPYYHCPNCIILCVVSTVFSLDFCIIVVLRNCLVCQTINNKAK